MIYAKSCVQCGLDYFEKQLATSLKHSLQVLKGSRLFLPQEVHSMQPDATAVEEALAAIPFLNSQEELDSLLQELPAYLAHAAVSTASAIICCC